MIASLPMYDLPPLHAANDRLWAGIRDRLRSQGCPAPEALTRGGDPWQVWQAPDLILSQTCGYPYRARLHGRVTLVGTPDFGVPGCAPGHYRSVFVVRSDDPRSAVEQFAHARFAYNEPLSQSGWAAPQTHAATLGFRFAPGLATGAHQISARAVAEDRADIAAIDAVTWALLQAHDAVAATLRVLAMTEPTPGLPYIAAQGADAAVLFKAIDAAIAELPTRDRDLLRLRGIVAVPAEAYLRVVTPPAP